MPEWILIILFIAIPAVIPLIAFWHLKRSTSAHQSTLYRYRIAGNEIAITGGLLQWLAITAFAIWWLEFIMPLPLMPILIGGLFFLFKKSQSTNQASKTSSELLDEISTMADQLKTAHSRVQQLAGEIELTQAEISRKTTYRENLDKEIDLKLQEAEEWESLTEEQKSLLVESVGEAVSNKSATNILITVVGSIVLNIAATLIWTLLGSPGKEELLEWFSSFS